MTRRGIRGVTCMRGRSRGDMTGRSKISSPHRRGRRLLLSGLGSWQSKQSFVFVKRFGSSAPDHAHPAECGYLLTARAIGNSRDLAPQRQVSSDFRFRKVSMLELGGRPQPLLMPCSHRLVAAAEQWRGEGMEEYQPPSHSLPFSISQVDSFVSCLPCGVGSRIALLRSGC